MLKSAKFEIPCFTIFHIRNRMKMAIEYQLKRIKV